jgi:putative phosphotransacetylase
MLFETDELVERVTRAVIGRLPVEPAPRGMEVPIGVSVRHIHLTVRDVEILFGEGHQMQPFNELYQKGYYAAKEQVLVVGPKGALKNVRVLGPPRGVSQVELAQTDALSIGLRLSLASEGRDAETQAVTLVGPEGTIRLPGGAGGGAFVVRRHVHLSDEDARGLGVKAGDLVDLKIGGPRAATLHDVLVRTAPGWRPEVHLDTDEANACWVRTGQTGMLMVRG